MDNVIEMQSEKAAHVGYKQTEIGIIPEDWEVNPLEKYTMFVGSGKTNTKSKGTFPLFGSTGQIGSCSNPEYHGDAILVARVGANAGKLSFVSGQYGVSDNTIIVKLKPQNNIHFFKYWLTYKNLNSLVFGSGQPLITGTQLKELLLPAPSINEQTAIANVLSDTDELITEFEKLIAKKQAIKTATMQQLLTGLTRLPQFSKHPDGAIKGYKSGELGHIPEGWEEREIGKFAPLQRGFDLPASKINEGLYPVVYSNGIANTHNHFQVQGPGVVTGRSGTLGKVHHIECNFWPHNTSLWVTRFINSDPKFVYYIFKYIGFERFASGSGVPTLNRNDAHSFKVAIPSSLKEQTAIATILSDMDTELTALERKLAKFLDIKQGMMQQLLTGRIRLPLEQQP